jgi:hypothetical protein
MVAGDAWSGRGPAVILADGPDRPEPKPADLDPEAWPPIGPPPGPASRAVVAAVACYFACAAVVVVSLIGIAAFVFAPLYLVARMIGRIP